MSAISHQHGDSTPCDKPARIVLENGDEYTVTHHFISEREQWVCAYDEIRAGGIDYRYPVGRVSVIGPSSGESR